VVYLSRGNIVLNKDLAPHYVMESDKFASNLGRQRQHLDEARQTPLVKIVDKGKNLDSHIHKFLSLIREDAENHNPDSLKSHAKDFESHIHDEMEFLFKQTQEDLQRFSTVLRALALYREELGEILKDERLSTLAASELNYAEVLMRDAGDKIDTLKLLFKKMQ